MSCLLFLISEYSEWFDRDSGRHRGVVFSTVASRLEKPLNSLCVDLKAKGFSNSNWTYIVLWQCFTLPPQRAFSRLLPLCGAYMFQCVNSLWWNIVHWPGQGSNHQCFSHWLVACCIATLWAECYVFEPCEPEVRANNTPKYRQIITHALEMSSSHLEYLNIYRFHLGKKGNLYSMICMCTCYLNLRICALYSLLYILSFLITRRWQKRRTWECDNMPCTLFPWVKKVNTFSSPQCFVDIFQHHIFLPYLLALYWL